MAKEKKESKEKAVSKIKKEIKDKKVKKEKVKKTKTEKKQDILVIDNIGYKTEFTKKYLQRKKFVTHNPNKITAFIPGTILEIFVSTGQKVSKGEALLILEAMKMNNKLIAPHDATVKKIYVKSGELVTRAQLLVELKV